MSIILRLAATLTAVALLCAPLPSMAQETAPLGRTQEEPANAQERLPRFRSNRGYMGVTASSVWLYQAKLGGKLLSLRLYTAQGEQITFQENLGSDGAGGIRLTLRAGCAQGPLLMQLDQAATDTLLALGITQIAVTDTDMLVLARYDTQDLADMRSVFALGERELLCVSGEDDPVTVVSEDGVRRQITE